MSVEPTLCDEHCVSGLLLRVFMPAQQQPSIELFYLSEAVIFGFFKMEINAKPMNIEIMNKLKIYILMLVVFLTTSCGVNIPIFSSSPNVSVDLGAYPSKMCGVNAGYNLSQIIPIDLNRDGKKDLLVSLWCTTIANNAVSSEPVISYLLAYLQDKNGNFSESTKLIFGKDVVDIGAGTSQGYMISDFNNDGYLDVVIVTNREDGRSAENNSRLSKNYIIQGGEYGYTAIPFGEMNYASSIIPIDNEFGKQDFIVPGFFNSPLRYSYLSNSWFAKSYDFVSGTGATIFFSRTFSNSGSTTAISEAQDSNGAFGLTSWNYVSGAWVKGESLLYPTTNVQKIDNDVVSGNTQMINVNGKNYLFPSFGLNCLIKKSPTGVQEALFNLNARLLIVNYVGQAFSFEDPVQLMEYDQLLSFSNVNGSIQSNVFAYSPPLPKKLVPNSMVCGDLNGDGYDDIYFGRGVREQSAIPVVYLNDKNGKFRGVNNYIFPQIDMSGAVWNYIIKDINGDQIPDLIYHTIFTSGGSNPRFSIYYGKRNMGEIDFQN